MLSSPLQSVRSPVIVGRAPHLAALDAHLDAVAQGEGRMLLLSGEAGVGKSRLVAEMHTRAAARGMLVLGGRCFEPDRAVPYAPLLAALRGYLAERPSGVAVRELGLLAPHVIDLLPEIAQFLPEPPPAVALGAEHAHHRRAHALAQFLTHLAATQPVVVVIEDIHWSDDASLDLLLAVARRCAGRAVLPIVTYRSDEVSPRLRHMLALLDRERLAGEIALPRLATPETEAMLRAIFGQPQPIRADFLRAIHDLTDGNPFFIEEVVRALIAAGDIFRASGRWERRDLEHLHIPRSVQDAVTRRADALSADAASVLRLAAVAGRQFDFTILQTLTGRDEPSLLAPIGELVAAQLVVEESAERFAFRHALTRQAIYATLLARERRSLHLSIAQAIERPHTPIPESSYADLSYHYTSGEAWERAMEYGERAGARALTLYAPHAAVAHFSRAIDAAAHRSAAPPARIYRGRGQALAMIGEFERARADYEAALSRVRAEGTPRAEWQALLDLGNLWSGQDYARSGAYLERSLALARTLDRPDAVADTLMHLGGWYLNTDRTDEAEAALQSALAIYERAGDRHGIARSIDLLGTVSDIAGDIGTMRRRYERAAALFRELGDRQGLCSTLAMLLIAGGAYIFETVVIPPYRHDDDAAGIFTEALALARAIGWRAGEAFALLNRTVHLGSRGDYRGALARARDALAIAREIEHREWTAGAEWGHGAILMDVLAYPQAQDCFARAAAIARASGSLHWTHNLAAYHAESRAMQGDLDGAAAAVAAFSPDLPMQTLGQRRVWYARAKIAFERGDAAGALAIVERLFASAAALAGPQGIPILALLRGQCLIALGRGDEAEESLRAAAALVSARGLSPIAWRLHVALGQIAAAQGRHDDARAQFHAARAIIDTLAATLPDEPLRRAFLAGAAAMLPAAPASAPAPERALLTPRERDVAMLVARGLANREIADELSIGERTVETHVGNILNKLGFGSRALIAAWAVASGIRQASTHSGLQKQ